MTQTDWSYPLAIFAACGIELEYMIVDAETLDVRGRCDELFKQATGKDVSDVEPDGDEGVVSWSNELALHVVELKTQRPVATLEHLDEHFQRHVRSINELLAPMNCRLLPTGMHPWMDPERETTLWPHEYNDIYRTYDRIFGCRGHGWGNLQSTHINLPFANDAEFGRLHAAIRLLLPLLPALAASSPVADGAPAPATSFRLEVYRRNSGRVPMMTGLVIPEPVFTREAYERDILGRLYADLEPLDPEGQLRHEFANARGAIARFDRGAVEIRVLDIQECPRADVAMVALIVEVIRALVDERWMGYDEQGRIGVEPLHRVLLDTIRDAEAAVVRDRSLLGAFGFTETELTAGEIWNALLQQVMSATSTWTPTLERMLQAGSLATRIRSAAGDAPSPTRLRDIYAELADCLNEGRLFHAG